MDFPPALVALAVLAVLALAGALLDLRHRILPNWLCGLTLLAGLGFALAQGGLALVGSSAAHAFVALLAGMGLFALGAIGGGDAKFYSAISAWFAIGDSFRLLFSVSLVGLALALLFWRGSKRARTPGSESASRAHLMVPYGVAIAVGAVIQKAAVVLA